MLLCQVSLSLTFGNGTYILLYIGINFCGPELDLRLLLQKIANSDKLTIGVH